MPSINSGKASGGLLAYAALLALLGCSGGAESCKDCEVMGAGGTVSRPGTAGAGGGTDRGGSGSGGTLAPLGTGGTSSTTTGSAGHGGAGTTGTAGANAGTSGGLGGTSTGGTAASTAGTSGGGGRAGSGAAGIAGAGGPGGSGAAAAGHGGASGGTTGAGGMAGSHPTAGGGGTTAGTAGNAAAGGSAAGAPAGRSGASGSAGTGGIAGAGGSAAGAGGAGPLVLSIDFVGGDLDGAAPTMDPTEVAGVKPAANWNAAADIMGTLSHLLLADGTSTTASVTWNSPVAGSAHGIWKSGFADAPGDARMMNGYLDPGAIASPAVVTVSGLPASFTAHGYDVYVYVLSSFSSAVTRTHQYTIGGTSVTVSETGPTPTTLPAFSPVPPGGGAGNYVVFKNLTGASFTLTATPATGGTLRAPVNGIQIVAAGGG